MKKVLLFMFVLTVAFSMVFAGCAGSAQTSTPPASQTVAPTVAPTESTAPAGAAYKTGLGAVISIAKSKSATADAGAVTEADVVMAAVTIDADGKIVNVKIDTTQSKVNFDNAGQLTTTDITSEVPTKVELGDAYGMKKNSAIGKEWFEQIAALEDWMVGKTIDEVMALSVNADGYTDNADLTASVTIHVGDYLNAVKKAVDNAQDFGVEVIGATKTGLGNVNSIAKSKSATADAVGLAETDDTMVAVTLDENNVVVGVIIDVAQVKVNVDATGAVTSDLTAGLKTKDELGDDYGMKKNSGIGKEWYEQAAALAQWMIGKTADEVMALSVNADGYTDDADLTASVTIHVSDYLNAFQKAVDMAD